MPGLPSGEQTKSNGIDGHRNSGFSHEKWWIFPWLFVCSAEGIDGCRENHRTNYGFSCYSDNLSAMDY